MPVSQGTTIRTRIGPVGWTAIVASAAILAWLIWYSFHHISPAPTALLPAYWGAGIAPFVGLLACIAFLPLLPATRNWWENNLHRLLVSLLFAGMTMAYVLFAEGGDAIPDALSHAIVEHYLPFMILLFALYVIAGGISLKGDLPAHPFTNTMFLAIGAGIASFIGTT